MFFGPLFPRIYGRHKFSLLQVLVENWRNDVNFSKYHTRWII